MMRTLCLALCIGLTFTVGATAVQAVTVSLDLVLDDAGLGTWGVYAAIEDEEDLVSGLETFRFDVWGTGGAKVTESMNESPMGTDYYGGVEIAPGIFVPLTTDNWGFVELRSDGDEEPPDPPKPRGFNIIAGQRSVGPTHDDAAVLQDVGEAPGSRQPMWYNSPYAGGGDTTLGDPVVWDYPVLLASGLYEGTTGALHAGREDGGLVNRSFACLEKVDGEWEGPGNLTRPDSVTGDTEIIPEPGTLVLLAVGALGLLVFWWRRK